MYFKDRLKSLRYEKGLTQEEIGLLLNQTKSNISKYENGRLQPNMKTVNFLSTFFDVSTDYLLGNTEERRPADKIKEVFSEYVTQRNNKFLDLLIKKVPELSEEEQEALLEHLEFALKLIEKQRLRRIKENDNS